MTALSAPQGPVAALPVVAVSTAVTAAATALAAHTDADGTLTIGCVSAASIAVHAALEALGAHSWEVVAGWRIEPGDRIKVVAQADGSMCSLTRGY